MMEIQNFWVRMRECFCLKLAEIAVQCNKVTSSPDFLQGLNLQRSFPTSAIRWKKLTLYLSLLRAVSKQGVFFMYKCKHK